MNDFNHFPVPRMDPYLHSNNTNAHSTEGSTLLLPHLVQYARLQHRGVPRSRARHWRKYRTAIFSVLNSVVLNALPFPGSDRIALIWETDLKDGITREGPSAPNFLDWQEQSRSFEDMSLLEVGTGTLTGEGEPEQVTGLRVTTNFLSMLGARTVLGRGFTEAEGAGQARYPVAVLTNGFWKRHFGSDPQVVGRTFWMNSEPYTVIGVLAPDFWQPLPSDLYVPWPIAQLRAKNRADHDPEGRKCSMSHPSNFPMGPRL
jgi:MacB-like protein